MLSKVLSTVDRNIDGYVEDLIDAIRHPSVSATNQGVVEAAEALVEHFRTIGFQARLLKSPGYPAIFAEVDLSVGSGAACGVSGGAGAAHGEARAASAAGADNRAAGATRTVLFYGHNDVQPVEPLDAWEHPPFDARLYGDYIWGRGSVDDKGNFYAAIKAVQAFREAGVTLPLRIKFIIESEEEIGSVHLGWISREYADVIKADTLLAVDGTIFANWRSEMFLGIKGMLSLELIARGPTRDLHSGKAPIIQNPAWRLIWALNTLKGPDGRVLIPGFYDDVAAPTAAELALLEQSAITDDMIKADVGDSPFMAGTSGAGKTGRPMTGLELQKHLFFDPTCNIAGLTSGYQGPGSKTVLPAEARVKLDLRMVPNQDPEKITAALRRHLDAGGFTDIEIARASGMPAGRTSPDSPIVAAALKGLTAAYGKPPVVKPSIEGSGPGYVFSQVMGLPWTWVRLGPPENRMHSPNERHSVRAYTTGIKAVAHILWEYAHTTVD